MKQTWFIIKHTDIALYIIKTSYTKYMEDNLFMCILTIKIFYY